MEYYDYLQTKRDEPKPETEELPFTIARRSTVGRGKRYPGRAVNGLRRFKGGCQARRTHDGKERVSFVPGLEQHTMNSTPMHGWECIISRWAWEATQIVSNMQPAIAAPPPPETVDFAGAARTFIRYVMSLKKPGDDVVVMPTGLGSKFAKAFYGTNVAWYLRATAHDMKWEDGSDRFPEIKEVTNSPEGAVDLVRLIAPRLTRTEFAQLKRQLRNWNGIGALLDQIMNLPEMGGLGGS